MTKNSVNCSLIYVLPWGADVRAEGAVGARRCGRIIAAPLSFVKTGSSSGLRGIECRFKRRVRTYTS